jgi:phosphate transport system substrate-binding protein
MLRRAIPVLLTLTCLSAVSCNPGADKGKIVLQGGGATFPAALYRKWFADYQSAHPEVKILYESVGSGAGVELFSEDKVDFGASDAAMTDEQVGKVKERGVLMLPMTAGIVVLAHNLPGVEHGLRLSREAYVGIFLGEIASWDDPKIAKENKGIELPKIKIVAVHRAGASGTTFVFAQHLSAVSEAWKKGPGAALTVRWPVGVAAKGTDGVAELIQQTPGAIGYLDLGYARKSKLAIATLQNKAGEYVEPNSESGQAALKSVELPENLRVFVPDPDGKDCYPIVTFSWLLVHKSYGDKHRADAFKQLCKYALTDGQKDCDPLGYIPLPQSVVHLVLQAVESIGP